MSVSGAQPIDYGRDQGHRLTSASVVQFVGGPRDGEREQRRVAPALINSERGWYRRSVRCADDGALRYVFEEDPVEIAHRTWIRPG